MKNFWCILLPFRNVPQMIQRIAGKSLPIEKFAMKKALRFFEQGKRLTLPGLVSELRGWYPTQRNLRQTRVSELTSNKKLRFAIWAGSLIHSYEIGDSCEELRNHHYHHKTHNCPYLGKNRYPRLLSAKSWGLLSSPLSCQKWGANYL